MADKKTLPLRATASVALADPDKVFRRICQHFAEHGAVAVDGRRGTIETDFGIARLSACDTTLTLDASGRDQTGLAYVKLSLAEHLLAFAEGQGPSIVWHGDGAAGSPLPYFREMRVSAVRDITPHMRRLVLCGEDIGRFEHGGLHVRLLFPPMGRDVPAWPVTGADGRPSWPAGGARPSARTYTIRRIDASKGEVEIDFVMHDGEGMPGAGFARQARIGDIVGMTGPGGGTVPEADWYLLAGDETALPAIARILEELPATARAVVRVEIADRREEQPLYSAADIDIGWLHRGGAAPGTGTQLYDAVRAVPFPASNLSIFAWAGCEHASFRAIRAYLRNDRKLARGQHLVAAYWRLGFEGETVRGGD